MDSQKIENELNLALDSTLEEREKSGNLNVGFDEADKTWELIVRYTGSLERFRILGISVVELLNGYAILTVPQNMVDMVAASNEIIYVEKPKGFFCEDRSCGFALWKQNRFFESIGKKMTKQTAIKLLQNGKVKLKGCKSQKTGKNYDENKTDAEKGITIEISNVEYTLVKE